MGPDLGQHAVMVAVTRRPGVINPWTSCLAASPTHCQTAVQPAPSRQPPGLSLSERWEWMASHIDGLVLVESGFRPIVLSFSPQDGAAFRSIATDWELKNSRIINMTAPNGVILATPIVDEISTVLAHFVVNSTGGYTAARVHVLSTAKSSRCKLLRFRLSPTRSARRSSTLWAPWESA